jgi:hypothetical protein
MNWVIKVLHGTKNEKFEAFYNLCSQDFNIVKIKKLLINPDLRKDMDGSLLVAGLLGAIKINKETYINLICESIEQKNIQLTQESTNILFNYAVINNNSKIMEILDDKFSILKSSITSNDLEHLQKNRNYSQGKSIYMNFMGLIDDVQALSINPFTFALIKNNFTLLDKMLEKDYPIGSQLVQSAFCRSVENGDENSAMYLINNDKTVDFLFNSPRINEILNRPFRYPKLKKEMGIILEAKELERTLKTNIEKKPPRLKL